MTTGTVNATGADLILFASTDTGTTPSDNVGGNTYTLIASYSFSTGQSINVWECRNPSVSGAMTFTGTVTVSTGFAIDAIAISGSLTSGDPQDQHNGNTQNFVSTIQPGSITPSQANSLIMAFLAISGTNTNAATIDSSFTVIDSYAGMIDGEDISSAYLIQTSAVAVNPTWNGGAGSQTTLNAMQISFKPGVAATFVLSGMDMASQAAVGTCIG